MNMGEMIVQIIRQKANSLAFNMLEIGALPLEGQPEPFHSLLQSFPGSRINAFEVDPELCKNLNHKAISGLVYHPVALGRTKEERPFYMTNHPMCASLYKPNEKLIGKYNSMEVAILKDTSTIKTVGLDDFASKNNIGPIDFIKIDIQGAELDVFQGGTSTLRNVVAIVTEVEFVPIYENQPLFGDVCTYLGKSGLSFHKFLGLSGRSLRPIVVNNDPFFGTQHMWADAIFIKSLAELSVFSSEQLLKLAVFAFMYGSPDVAIYCLTEYDRRQRTDIVRELQLATFEGGNTSQIGHAGER